jgi:hypothetical protein
MSCELHPPPIFGQKNFAVPFRKRMHNSSSSTTTTTIITKTKWGPQTFQKSRNPFNIPSARRVTISKFHT